MIFEAWLSLTVALVCLGAMATNRVAPDIALLGGLTVLLATDILTPAEAFAGFANDGVITVAVLYVVVSGLKETGAIGWIVHNVLGRPSSLAKAQLRLIVPVGAISAFLNNTPVVAMFVPAVADWAKKNNLAVSKLMMPLSYAAIVGGLCSLIGTSTNLVINGLLIKETGISIGMFDIAWIGVPLTLATFVYVLVASNSLLPDSRAVGDQFADPRKFIVEMMVESASPLVGKTIEQAGLRHLPGLFLIEIDRNGHILAAVSPQEMLHANDRLIFAGVVDSVVDLQKIRGLVPATNQVFKLDAPRVDRCLVQAVVSSSCSLIGKSIREGRFRSLYNAAVIAVARDGETLRLKIGDIVLKPGDTLLLETHPDFVEQQRNNRDFYLVSRVADSTPPRHDRAFTALIILVAMVVLAGTGVLSMLKASLLAAGAMLISRCTRGRVARRSVDWQVLIVIAASFALGAALQKTGAAATIANHLIDLSGGNPWAAMSWVFVTTAFFTAIATNNTAAILMFPIAQSAAQTLSVDFLPFVFTIMVAASASFATPIGYQTNLMVYGPGGYRFADYLRFGLPLTLVIGIMTIVLTPMIWPFTKI